MQSEDDVIDLSKIFTSLRAGWRVILGVVGALVVIGLIYVQFIAVPIYTAKSVVVLDTRKTQVVDFEGIMSGMTGGSDELNTEVQVLKSRSLAGKVVDQLNLIADPEFNSALKPPSVLQKIKSVISSPSEPAPEAIHARVVSALLDAVSVRNVPSSYVFDISVTSTDPLKAAKIADTLAQLYILNQIEVKFDASEQATQWLANRVAELKSELEKAEERAKAFNSQTSLVSPEMLASLEVQNKDLRERIDRASEQALFTQNRVDALKSAQSREEKAEAANDLLLSRLADGGDAAEFDARYTQVIARAELDLARAVDQKSALVKSQESLAAQITRQGDDLIQLQQLNREAEASGTLYEYFLSRLKETSAQQGIQQADSRMLSQSVVPTVPTAPRKSLVLVFCVSLGLLIGASIVLLREAMKNSFRTARELEDMTGIVVMGQIPLIPGKARNDIMSYMRTKPTSAAMEAIRNLRTSVLLSNVDNPPQIIISTSSVPGEGKTTNSLGLAMNLVGIGKSVLLIEGDIRRNTLSEYFPKVEGEKGLVSLLSGSASLDEVLIEHKDLGLSMIMGERSSINAADLFMSDSYRDFLSEMRKRFDYIIIDTPPVLVVPDARIISQSADAVLFTVKWNNTSRGLVEEAIQMFDTVNQRVTGLILSQVDGEEMKRYGGKYGGYGTGAGYGAKYYTN